MRPPTTPNDWTDKEETTMAYETELEAELEQELEDEMETELEDEGEFEFEAEGESEYEYEGELEDEFEFEDEGESEVSPIRKVYPDAMMEHLGALAAESESEEEAAEHFLPLIGMAAGKLLPLAAKAIGPLARKALPRVVKAVGRVAPKLTRAVGRIARTIHRNPAARQLLRTVPNIARRTVYSIARQAARGRPITARRAIRTLARQTSRVLRNPHHRRRIIRLNHRHDRRFHRHLARGVVNPHRSTPMIAGGTAHPASVSTGTRIRGGGRTHCPVCGTSARRVAVRSCRCCGRAMR
jgi:hypothetical protein